MFVSSGKITRKTLRPKNGRDWCFGNEESVIFLKIVEFGTFWGEEESYSTCMYCSYNTFMSYSFSKACTIAIVHACAIAIGHACTIAIIRAL